MKALIVCLAVIAISTLSFWAGQTDRGWVAFPVGGLAAAVAIYASVPSSNHTAQEDAE